MYGLSRGELLNNPTNIRKSNSQWIGKVYPGRDKDFETFDSSLNGIRAACKIFLNYQRQHGLNTILGIISRWAPPSDNNPTASYASFVAGQMGIGVDDPVNLETPSTLQSLITVVITEESGHNNYSQDEISQAVSLALA